MLCQLSYTHHSRSLSNPPRRIAAAATEFAFRGAPEGIRTPDPRLRRPLLFPPELLAHIGASRFERPTPCSQGRCATKLRYAPSLKEVTHGRWPLNRPSCGGVFFSSIYPATHTTGARRAILERRV